MKKSFFSLLNVKNNFKLPCQRQINKNKLVLFILLSFFYRQKFKAIAGKAFKEFHENKENVENFFIQEPAAPIIFLQLFLMIITSLLSK